MADGLLRTGALITGCVLLGLGAQDSYFICERGMTQNPLRASVTTDKAEIAPGEAITFTLRVENASADTVTLEFVTSQRYDFVVRSATQDTVWRWGSERGFMQVLGEERLAPGGVIDYHERCDAQFAPGRYTVTGLVAARNAPLLATAEFTVVEEP